MKTYLLPFAIAAAAVGCSTISPTEDPVYLKMTDLEARLLRIERVFENESLIQLSSELDQLKTEVSALRGEIETLRFETQNASGRQRELYLDVDRRLQSLEDAQSRAPAGPPGAAAPAEQGGFAASRQPQPESPPPEAAAPPRPVGTDTQNYQSARELLEARRYPEAGNAFREFLSAFPSSPLVDNAQYWLAETYYVQRQFQEALTEFQKVLEYPQSAKFADALLKVGYCQDELKNPSAARTALQQVVRQFPDTTTARLASQRLDRLSR